MHKLCLIGPLVLTQPTIAQGQAESGLEVSGDLRLSYQHLWRSDRDRSETEDSELAARMRLRLNKTINTNWSVRARLAATFADEGNETEFFIRPERQSPTAMQAGSITVDESYLRWQSDNKKTDIRVGRQGHAIRLPLLVDRSFDRDTANNVDIGYNDGIQLTQRVGSGWKGNFF